MKTYLEILELSSKLPKYFCPLNCITVANSYTQHPLTKMTPHPAQFLAGKRIIVAGGSFAALSFVLALDQLWNPSLDRPEVIIYEKNEREECLEKDPYTLNINGASHNDGRVAIQQLGVLGRSPQARVTQWR